MREGCVIIRVCCGLWKLWVVRCWRVVVWWGLNLLICMRYIKFCCVFEMCYMVLLVGKLIDFVLSINLCWWLCWVMCWLKSVCNCIGVRLVWFVCLWDVFLIGWMLRSGVIFYRWFMFRSCYSLLIWCVFFVNWLFKIGFWIRVYWLLL